jgi:urea transport system substrate-binding protein
MSRENGSHPPLDRLNDFALRRLSDADSASIEAHLVACPHCCTRLAGMQEGDAFLSRLKTAATPGGNRPPWLSPNQAEGSPKGIEAHEPLKSAAREEVPEGLRDHPRYRVLGVLGCGGMGTVFKAEHRLLERPVVIKVLHPELIRDRELLERFRREARLAAKLAHPNVVTVYEAEQIGPVHLLVMEFVDGQDLAELLRRRGSLPVAVACELARQAALGLQHIHEQGLVHRDVKPANLMLTESGQVKLLDLGLAFLKAGASQERDLTLPQQSMGTVNYMAPEQWEDSHGVDIRADIYSLGCTLYHLLAGAPPFATPDAATPMRQMWAHSLASVPPIREKRPDVPEELAAFLGRMLAKNRAERPAVPSEVALALEPFAADCDVSFYLASGTVRSIPLSRSGVRLPVAMAAPPSRRRWLAAALALIGAAGVGGVGVYMSRLASQPTQKSPAGVPSAAPASIPPGGPPIRVGVLHSLTGTMAISEKPVVDATLLAIDELNERGGVLGRKVEAVVEDGASDGPTFARLAEKLITQDQVCTVFGCWTSASRKMVKPVFEGHDHLLFYPVQYEGLELSPSIVYLGAAPNQQIIPAIRWCCAFLNKRRLFLVGSDYVFPRCANAVIRDQAATLGAEVVGEEYVLLGSQDVSEAVKKIVAARPDVVLNTLNGDSNVAFFRALRGAGITPEKLPTISFSVAEEELSSLRGQDVAGDYAAWSYFMSIDRPQNREFVSRFQARYGRHRLITDPMEAAYCGVHLWADAVQAAATDQVRAIRAAIKDRGYDAPEGPVRVDPATQHTAKISRIGKILISGRFEEVFSSVRPIPPQPYPDTRSRDAWDSFLTDLNRRWGGQWANPGDRSAVP